MSSSDAPDTEATAEGVASLVKAGAFTDALALAERVVAGAPDAASSWQALSVARISAGDFLGSYHAAIQALKLDPSIEGARENAEAAREALRLRYRAALTALQDPRNEGEKLEAAFHAVSAADDAGVLEDEAKGVALGLFLRLAAVEEADRRWPFRTIGFELADLGDHRNLIYQIPRPTDLAGRVELLAQHRRWGQGVEQAAAVNPIRSASRGPRSRPRVGLVSSDLRIHPVAAFADPLVEHANAAGVELFCYSAHPAPPDGYEQHLATATAGFRRLPGASATELAHAIAADAPDVLVDIGGSTNQNRVGVMAHRLAPRQVSWLGYPHSVGLLTIDHIVVDPYIAPTQEGLLLETPLTMPRSWIALSRGYFRDDIPLASELPSDRKGVVTFGSAGSPYKYTMATLDAWARVLAAVPRSRFLFLRPEGGSPSFRRNVATHFARRGVTADRLDFVAVRSAHLPYYREIDISLDTMPLTGGMTTCEALWMGVPVVTLAGPALFERLSHSLLQNAGLAALSTDTVDAYVECAVALAENPTMRRSWLRDGRAALRAAPLGDTQQFALDLYRLLTAGL